MAKLSKSQLKEIVKECLVEILSEGLSGKGTSHLLEPMQESKSRRTKRSAKKRMPTRASSPALEKVAYAPHHEQVPHDRFDSAVDETVGTLTSDPMMAAIFADTARTTLQEQTGHDGSPGSVSQVESFAPGQDVSEVDIFADSSKNWAALAFAGDNTNGK
jgi:hypothetical protein